MRGRLRADTDENNLELQRSIRHNNPAKALPALEAAGTLFSRAVNRAADNINTVESKIRMQVHLTHIDQLPAREKTKMVVEVAEVDRATTSLINLTTLLSLGFDPDQSTQRISMTTGSTIAKPSPAGPPCCTASGGSPRTAASAPSK